MGFKVPRLYQKARRPIMHYALVMQEFIKPVSHTISGPEPAVSAFVDDIFANFRVDVLACRSPPKGLKISAGCSGNPCSVARAALY